MYVTAEDLRVDLDPQQWDPRQASSPQRHVPDGAGGSRTAHDAVPLAVRRP